MCVSAQLQIEFEAGQRWHNRRVTEEIFGRKPIYAASCFDRPAWPVITAQEPDTLQLMNWCYLPPHAASEPIKFIAEYSTYNAKCENVYTGRLYRHAMEQRHRCLIPVTGFYEHRHVGKLRIPYLVQPIDGGVWFFAGIYNAESRTYAIVTTEANDLMAQIHNARKRQPVILPPGFQEQYLENDFDADTFPRFCAPMPHQVMQYHTVSKLLTARGVDRNVPAVAEPFAYPEVPPIELAA